MTDVLRNIYTLTGHTNPTDLLTLADGQAVFDAVGAAAGKLSIATPQQFGAAADGVTDDSAAFVAAIAYLKAHATTGYGYADTGSAKLFIPSGVYNLNTTTLDITHGLIIEGETGGGTGPGSTVLKWAAGVTGIRTQNYNTTGATAIIASPTSPFVYGVATIRNLLLQGTFSGAESEAHGIHMRTSATVENVSIYNFAGDGVHIVATAGSGVPSEGNDNSFHLKRVFAQGNRNGFYWQGGDANAGNIIACNAISNRAWGFWDSSFLGNTYAGCHAAGNGWGGATIPTACTYSGNRYYVMPGQSVGASTNAPSGTPADNTWWGYNSAGGVNPGVVAWVSGTTFREGGSYKTDSANAQSVFDGCYCESDQNPPQIAIPAVVLGGFAAVSNKGQALTIRSDTSGNLNLNAGIMAQGGIGAFGNTTGTDFSAYAQAGIGARYAASNFHEFFVAFSRVHYTSSAGINLDSGKVVTVNGTQVLAARQTGWTAATGTPSRGAFAATAAGTVSAAYVQAEAQASRDRIAALEARLIALEVDARTHGLID